MPASGVLDEDTIKTRKDKFLFQLPWSSFGSSAYHLWRDDTQPGDAMDARDEQCTAQSWPGEQPEYLGIDDFECNGIVMHNAICQVPMEEDDDDDDTDDDHHEPASDTSGDTDDGTDDGQ